MILFFDESHGSSFPAAAGDSDSQYMGKLRIFEFFTLSLLEFFALITTKHSELETPFNYFYVFFLKS